MCDYSLQKVRSRPAEVGDRLVTRDFGTGTRGFACQEDRMTAVCVQPGTELAFEKPVRTDREPLIARALRSLLRRPTPTHRTAIFRQINRHIARTHHDALEFPDGTVSLLTRLVEGQQAVVLQLPAAPRSREEAAERERVAFVGLLTWDEAAAKSIIEIRPRPGSLFAKPPRSFETVRQCRKSN